MSHYIGLDVGTGSARACLIDENGDILSVADKDIETWHDKAGYYVRLVVKRAKQQEQSTDDIWAACCSVTRQVVQESGVDPKSVKGIGFDATCSLAVLSQDESPVSVSGPDFTDNNRNVILWCDVQELSLLCYPYTNSIERLKRQKSSTIQSTLY